MSKRCKLFSCARKSFLLSDSSGISRVDHRTKRLPHGGLVLAISLRTAMFHPESLHTRNIQHLLYGGRNEHVLVS
jgi:hypothetical protein